MPLIFLSQFKKMKKNGTSQGSVRITSINSFITRENDDSHSYLTKCTLNVLKEFKEGISRREIAFEITKRCNMKIAASSISHPVRILQEKGLVKELIRKKREGYEHARHIIKHVDHIQEHDRLSKKQMKMDVD